MYFSSRNALHSSEVRASTSFFIAGLSSLPSFTTRAFVYVFAASESAASNARPSGLGQTCAQCVIAIDYRKIHIGQHGRKSRRFHFDKFDLMFIFRDILRRRFQPRLRIELDQSFRYQKLQRAGFICRIIGIAIFAPSAILSKVALLSLPGKFPSAHSGYPLRIPDAYRFLIKIFK